MNLFGHPESLPAGTEGPPGMAGGRTMIRDLVDEGRTAVLSLLSG